MSISKFTLLIDDRDIESFGLRLVNYETQSYVGRKVKGVDIPGAHGTQEVPSRLSTNSFIANVVCTGQDADEVHERVRQFFAFMYSVESARKIVFTNDMKVVRYAILDSPGKYKVIDGVDCAMTEIKLTFLMLDPFTYQSDVDSFVMIAGHGKQFILDNDAFECPAIFKLKNTGNSKISNPALIVNEELASFSCELQPGDEIVLDTEEYEVRFNGDNRLDYWRGEMPMLKNGDNIVYQQNSNYAELLLTIEFTKQWV